MPKRREEYDLDNLSGDDASAPAVEPKPAAEPTTAPRAAPESTPAPVPALTRVPTVTVVVRCPEDLHVELKAISARKGGRSIQAMLVEAIAEIVRRDKGIQA